jgi:hypothetical protein
MALTLVAITAAHVGDVAAASAGAAARGACSGGAVETPLKKARAEGN